MARSHGKSKRPRENRASDRPDGGIAVGELRPFLVHPVPVAWKILPVHLKRQVGSPERLAFYANVFGPRDPARATEETTGDHSVVSEPVTGDHSVVEVDHVGGLPVVQETTDGPVRVVSRPQATTETTEGDHREL